VYIVEQGIAGVLRQWQADLSPTFAANSQCPLFPIDIIKTRRQNVASPQTKTGQEQQDRPIADASWRRGITGSDQPFDIGHRKVPRQSRQSPMGYSRHGVIKPWAADAARRQEPQVPPQCHGHRPDIDGRASPSLVKDDPPDKAYIVCRRITAECRQQSLHNVTTKLECPRRDASVASQPFKELGNPRVRRFRRRGWRRHRHNPSLCQEANESADAVHVPPRYTLPPPSTGTLASMASELFDDGLINIV
jgi:hypothetical protein